jgi:hypothetical protein
MCIARCAAAAAVTGSAPFGEWSRPACVFDLNIDATELRTLLEYQRPEIVHARCPPRICTAMNDLEQCIVGEIYLTGRFTMMYRTMVLAVAAFSSVQASAADMQSVYVAPGGVYIASARVYVTPGLGNGQQPYVEQAPAYVPAPTYVPGPAYAPGYVTPPPAYRAPAYHGSARPVYAPPPVYIQREPAYSSPYAAEHAPRPPAAVPYNGRGRCVVNSHGRVVFCD